MNFNSIEFGIQLVDLCEHFNKMIKINALPNAVENGAIGEDADVDVGHDDVVKVSLSFVGEEEIGHPDFVGIRQREVFDFACGCEVT